MLGPGDDIKKQRIKINFGRTKFRSYLRPASGFRKQRPGRHDWYRGRASRGPVFEKEAKTAA